MTDLDKQRLLVIQETFERMRMWPPYLMTDESRRNLEYYERNELPGIPKLHKDGPRIW